MDSKQVIDRKELPVINPKIGETHQVLLFQQGENKCGVWLNLNRIDYWETLGFKTEPCDLGILQPNTIIVGFKPVTELQMDAIEKNWIYAKRKEKDSSLFSDFVTSSLVSPFSYNGENNILVRLRGNLEFLKELPTYITDDGLSFIKPMIDQILSDPLLKKLF